MKVTGEWVTEAVKSADLAQTKYKKTSFDKPWPEWEKQREIALQVWIKDQK